MQSFFHCQCFFLGVQVSSTIETDCHNVTKILLKVVLKQVQPNPSHSNFTCSIYLLFYLFLQSLWICLICGNIGCGRYYGQHAHRYSICVRAVMAVIIWQLDLQPPMQSVPITTDVVSSIRAGHTRLCNKVCQ